MTVYKDFRFLDEAVESVLLQDFADIELILVDDGNRCDEMFKAIAKRDPRIRVINNPANLGTAIAANRGIEAAQSEIIVRLDADDIAEPGRVGKLVAALAADSGLGLIGSSATFIDEAGKTSWVWNAPESDVDIRWTILFHNPFCHSAVAYRKSLFERAGRYRPNEFISQDHYLWFDMLPLCRARNIREPLVRYRCNTQGLALTSVANARSRTHAIREISWKRLGIDYDLYDDAFAAELSEWIRGGELPAEKRVAAYLKILPVLRGFVSSAPPCLDPEYQRNLLQLTATSIARMLQAPPAARRDLLKVFGACWSVSPTLAIKAASRQLARRLP